MTSLNFLNIEVSEELQSCGTILELGCVAHRYKDVSDPRMPEGRARNSVSKSHDMRTGRHGRVKNRTNTRIMVLDEDSE